MSRPSRSSSGAIALKFAVLLLVLAAVLAVVAISIDWQSLLGSSPTVEPGQPVTVEIPKGSGAKAIAQILADSGVVSDAAKFRAEAESSGADAKLKPGTYDLSTGMPTDLVIEKLVAGPAEKTFTVTIPEGFLVKQIAKRVAKNSDIREEDFLELAEGGAAEFEAEHPYLKDAYKGSLEGYLFPKTYTFKEGATAEDVISRMLAQFDREMESVDMSEAERRGLSYNEFVTLASLVEREARLDKDRPKVASVAYSRLKLGMRLQMCASVEYVTPGNKLRLSGEDLKIDSPYNTYIHKGLPPGPIANPGLASLKAAAKPADTDYIYYVLTGKDGSHTFASSNEEFLKAKRKSKAVFGE